MAPLNLNEQAWTDFEVLISAYMDATKKILQEDKHVIPMAMIFDDKDEPAFIALHADTENDHIDIAEHLRAYRQLLRTHPNNTHACLLGYDVRLNHPPGFNDAIVLELEHTNGTLQKMFIPYRFTGFLKKKLEMGQAKLTDPGEEHILNGQL